MSNPSSSALPSASLVVPGIRRWLTLAVILCGTFMVILDFFIVNVALPAMQNDLQASAGQIEFVVAGYGLANAAMLISGGRLGDLYGRRRLFMQGLFLFTLASAACGFAPQADFLIAARILQGAAGALLQPQVLAMLNTLYKEGDRARAFGWYGIVLGLAATGGQLIGGALIHADVGGFGWRNCFLINVPIGLVVLLLARRLIPALPGLPNRRLDLAGMGFTILVLTAVLVPLIDGREQGWPMWSWLTIACAPLVLAVFALHQRRLEQHGLQPLIPLSLFSHRIFTTGLLVTILFYASNASFYFVLALYLQQGLGLDAFHGGLVFAALAGGFFATSMSAPRLGARLGEQTIAAGALLLAVGHGAQYLILTTPMPGQVPPALIVLLIMEGAGIGMVMAPLVAKSLSGLKPEHAGVASGVLAMMQQVGNALGVAIIGILYYRGNATQGFAMSLLYLGSLALAVALVYQLLVREEKRKRQSAQ